MDEPQGEGAEEQASSAAVASAEGLERPAASGAAQLQRHMPGLEMDCSLELMRPGEEQLEDQPPLEPLP